MKSKRVAFFAQDEGSAKALAPVIREWTMRDAPILMVRARGAAVEAFKRMGIPFTISEPGEVMCNNSPRPDLVVTGASMRVSIEKKAIRFARSQGITSVTLLDSPLWPWWRFSVDGSRDLSVLPDHILVPDPGCKERMMAEGFPAARLTPTGNPHFDTLIGRSRAAGPDGPGGILLVTQPRYEDGVYKSDFDWLQTVLGKCRLQAPDKLVIIRPHGKEDRQPFSSFISDHVHVDYETEILDLLASQSLVIGKNSSALLEACIMGKHVISYSTSPAELLQNPFVDQDVIIHVLEATELTIAIGDVLEKAEIHRLPAPIPFYNDGLNRQRVVDFLDSLMREQME